MPQQWKCPQCGLTLRSPDTIRMPVHCGCGLIDNATGNLTDLETLEIIPVESIVIRYARAVQRWIDAGRPNRTDEEIERIFRDYCEACPYLKESRCTHKNCGCQIRNSTKDKIPFLSWLIPSAMLNKLRMGTEVCPDGRWQ